MKIVMIGAGNVATHLSEALQKANHSIIQVYSRTEMAAKVLSEKLNCNFTTQISEIYPDADLYFYCLKDDVLPEIIKQTAAPEAIHIHTSGSTSIDVFSGKKKFGVLYPLQSFSKNKSVSFADIPLFLEASDDKVYEVINVIAKSLSGNVHASNSSQRLKLHIAAVFACNFVNFMYDTAADIIHDAELPFEILTPLIAETADKINFLSPFEAQTGPAVRFDTNIISKHTQALASDDYKRKLYEEISRQIFERHKNKDK